MNNRLFYLCTCCSDCTCGTPTNQTPTTTSNATFMTASLVSNATTTVDNNSPVAFNFVDTNNNSNIILNDDGTIALTKTGTYLVNWWVLIEAPAEGITADFALKVTQNTDQIFHSGGSTSGLLYVGNAVFAINNVPATLEVVNLSGDTITYAANNVKAMITITKIN